MDAERGFWLQLLILTMVTTIWLSLKVLTAYRQYQHHNAMVPRIGKAPVSGSTAQAVAGAGIALAQPLDLSRTVQTLAQNAPTARYRFPLGWSCVAGQPARGARCGRPTAPTQPPGARLTRRE